MAIRIFRILLIGVLILSNHPFVWSQTSSPLAPQMRGTKVVRYVQNGEFKDVDLYDGSYALVIGMSKYEKWDKLKGPVEDVQEVKNVLIEHGFEVQVEMDLTGKQLKETLDQFVAKHGNSGKKRLIVYFAGHGTTLTLPDKREMGFIVPVDAPLPQENQTGFFETAMSMDSIKAYALYVKTTHALFVFDSCFSGFLTRSESKIVPPHIGVYLDNAGRQFITSGAANQKVPDDSTFRRYFVSGLRGDADNDNNRDGYITGLELYQYLFKKVTGESKRDQTPQYGTIQDSNFKFGDMVFFLTRNPADVTEEQAWSEAKDKNTEQSYTIFLNSFAGGKHYNEAISSLIVVSKKNAPVQENTGGNSPEVLRSPPLVPQPFKFNKGTFDFGGNLQIREEMLINSVDEDLGGGVKMKLVRIPGGKFKMGSEKANEEKPVHEVTVPEFHMSIYEVTKEQWQAVAKMKKVGNVVLPLQKLGENNLPVINISWEEAEEFCVRLSRFTGRRYSLPSEAEWEYAARAETDTPFSVGSKLNPQFFNFDASLETNEGTKGISRKTLVEVGSLGIANKYGLFDMHGNVAEWCKDDWADTYDKAPTDGSAYISGSTRKVIRGGSYASLARRVCSTCRVGDNMKSDKIGFRVVMRSMVNYPNV